jgi:hypothetical protein
MEPSADLSYSPCLDHHFNVPTLVCARLPEISLLFGCIFSFVEHGRDLLNVEYLRHLEARYFTAVEERRRKQELFEELREELRTIPKKKKFRKQRQELERRLEGLKKSTPEKGIEIHALCRRTTAHGSERVTLGTEHILGLAEVTARDELELVAARVRHGKIVHKLRSLDEIRAYLKGLDRKQALPHLWRGLPSLYASIFGLAYMHQLDHDLDPGTCYYARTRGDEDLYTSTLLLEQCGYKKSYYARGKLMQLQIEILKRITISGSHGKHHFDEVPLLEEGRIQTRARDLPKGVRSGEWATLSIPKAIWKLQGNQFAQVPAALLRSRDLYTVNLGLILMAEEAYKHEREGVLESGYTFELERLIDQASLRQVFRAHHSRDEKWLGRALGDLEAMAIITKVESKKLEQLASERLETQLELSFDAPVEEETIEVTPTRTRQRVARRQFNKVLAHEKLAIHLYRRVLRMAPVEQHNEEVSSQTSLPSTG